MSFDSYLPHALITKLYKDVLYDIDSAAAPKIKKPVTFKSILGSNKKQITIIVAYDSVPALTEKPLKFLLDVLSACKLTMADVAIINPNPSPTASFEAIVSKFSPRITLCFALQPVDLNLPPDLAALTIHEINKNKLLLSPSLEAIEFDVALKKQFWLLLRKLFEV